MLAAGRDEIDIAACEQHLSERDLALQQVRAQTARTRSAWKAKLGVLFVMRDWLDVESPELSAFAVEVATEAAALFDNDRGQDCVCHEMQGETFERQPRAAERRNPFTWFARPWGPTTDTPFAN